MHRVELKALIRVILAGLNGLDKFLMHRVELKGLNALAKKIPIAVPNAPCGVESQSGGHPSSGK